MSSPRSLGFREFRVKVDVEEPHPQHGAIIHYCRAPVSRACHVSYTSTHSTLSSHECMHVRDDREKRVPLLSTEGVGARTWRRTTAREEDRRRSTRVVLHGSGDLRVGRCDREALRVFRFSDFANLGNTFMVHANAHNLLSRQNMILSNIVVPLLGGFLRSLAQECVDEWPKLTV